MLFQLKFFSYNNATNNSTNNNGNNKCYYKSKKHINKNSFNNSVATQACSINNLCIYKIYCKKIIWFSNFIKILLINL